MPDTEPETGPTLAQIEAFLVDLHGTAVTDLAPVAGGFWSTAWTYVVDGRELVLRIGSMPEGFVMDREAMAFDRPELPVPEVLDIGEAFGAHYAVSLRHHGQFLESVGPEHGATLGPTVVGLLDALRTTPVTSRGTTTAWTAADSGAPTWRDWLRAGFVDDPGRHTHGWRPAIAADDRLDALFRGCEERVHGLLDAVPERRDLVHGDLLHGNVLVSDDATRVTAVFSWKCSVLGDFLYDTAWCTFWSAWHQGIDAADVWGRMTAAGRTRGDEWADATARHHCYELHIGAVHLGWYVWTEDADNLRRCADRLDQLLDRGPLRVL